MPIVHHLNFNSIFHFFNLIPIAGANGASRNLHPALKVDQLLSTAIAPHHNNTSDSTSH